MTYSRAEAQTDGVGVTWDIRKNAANVKKHGLSFEEAAELLSSDLQLVLFDEDHSEEEVRYISAGPTARGTVVVWTEGTSTS